MQSIVNRAKRKYRTEGIVPVVLSAPAFARNQIRKKRDEWRGSNFHYQIMKEEGIDERWDMIEPHLEEDTSVLDVGCNAAMFTERAAEQNRFSIGIEKNGETVRDAVKYHGESLDFGIMNKPITRKTVSSFPTFDYVFLFSIYHHIYRLEGATVAEDILRQLAEKTADTLFFEPASKTEWYGDDELEFEDNDVEAIVEYNTAMLNSVIERDVRVEYLGSRTRGTDGERCLLAVHME